MQARKPRDETIRRICRSSAPCESAVPVLNEYFASSIHKLLLDEQDGAPNLQADGLRELELSRCSSLLSSLPVLLRPLICSY